MQVGFSTNTDDFRSDFSRLNRSSHQTNRTGTYSANSEIASNFGLAVLILGTGALLVILVCCFIDLMMVYICCVVESPFRRYHEEQARTPSGKRKKKNRKSRKYPVRNSKADLEQITAL